MLKPKVSLLSTTLKKLLRRLTVGILATWRYQLFIVPVVFLLIPDQVQPRVFNGLFVPHLQANATIVVASGYNILFKHLQFKPTYDVVMVAPRCIFSS